MKKKQGFTLIELIVVVAILTALMLILVPSLTGFTETAKHTAARTTIRNLQTVYESSELLVHATSGLSRNVVSDPDGEFSDYQSVIIYGRPELTADAYSEAVRDKMKENMDLSETHNFQVYASYNVQGAFEDLLIYYYDQDGKHYYSYTEPDGKLEYCLGTESGAGQCEVIAE